MRYPDDYEVLWNGGELLPPRPEGTPPMWRYMLNELESALVKRVLNMNEKLKGEGIFRSGRMCACGCGQEMVYAASTKPRDRRTAFKTGHQWRVRSDSPWFVCAICATPYQSQARVTKHCSTACKAIGSEALAKARRAA